MSFRLTVHYLKENVAISQRFLQYFSSFLFGVIKPVTEGRLPCCIFAKTFIKPLWKGTTYELIDVAWRIGRLSFELCQLLRVVHHVNVFLPQGIISHIFSLYSFPKNSQSRNEELWVKDKGNDLPVSLAFNVFAKENPDWSDDISV